MSQVGKGFYNRAEVDLIQNEAQERAEELFDFVMDEEKTKEEVLEIAKAEGEEVLSELQKYF